MPRFAAALIIGFTFALTTACGDPYDDDPATPTTETITGGQPMLRTVGVQLDDGETVTVEVADDTEERTKGLSGRNTLPDNTGMLFVWDDETQHTLWMDGMLFDLDMVWLDASRTVVSIDADIPTQPGVPTSELTQYHPAGAAKYAIELDAGEAAALGIDTGDALEFDEGTD
jgi:uncharacterized membrane protein (UPF0127 family)